MQLSLSLEDNHQLAYCRYFIQKYRMMSIGPAPLNNN